VAILGAHPGVHVVRTARDLLEACFRELVPVPIDRILEHVDLTS